jgi:hypothetical protein
MAMNTFGRAGSRRNAPARRGLGAAARTQWMKSTAGVRSTLCFTSAYGVPPTHVGIDNRQMGDAHRDVEAGQMHIPERSRQ